MPLSDEKKWKAVRQPVVAGLFYPSDRDELFETIHRCFTSSLGPGQFPKKIQTDKAIVQNAVKRVECLIVPHAGYMHSGPVAAHSYSIAHDFIHAHAAAKHVNCVIFGPNHLGIGSGVALSPARAWRTPLGDVAVDETFSTSLARKSSIIDIDELSHSREHSIEVQLPFLQSICGTRAVDLSFVPICFMLQDIDTAREVANEVYTMIEKSEEPFLILGSSDLSHYETQREATSKDHKLLESVEKLDLLSFYSVLERLNVTSCGYGAIATVMEISRRLGCKRGTLLKYATSAYSTGDESSVVGYPAVHFV